MKQTAEKTRKLQCLLVNLYHGIYVDKNYLKKGMLIKGVCNTQKELTNLLSELIMRGYVEFDIEDERHSYFIADNALPEVKGLYKKFAPTLFAKNDYNQDNGMSR